MYLVANRCLTFLHYFTGYYGRETGYEPIDWSAGMLRIGTGALFLGVVDLFNSVDDSQKVMTYGDCP
jgi:hypothetical protein